MTSDLPDVEPTCAHCEKPQRGYAAVNGIPLCHPDTGLDCYSLVTLAGHDMPCGTLDADRRYCEAVDDFMAQFEELAADHHARLAAGTEEG